ncbi:hypothetical protein [Gelidibacter sp.]|uniref:hypothetical protein n=1 Tax=Gelidibacter sp. TaxID=2018083 RepID=UPI003263341E
MKRKNLLDISNSGLPKSQKEIEAIKKVFLSKDIMHKEALKNNEVLDLDLNKSKIQAEVIIGKSVRIVHDVFGFEEEQVNLEMDCIEIDFYEEFKEALETLFENYCKKILSELDRKGIYTAESVEGYKEIKLNKINKLISVLEKESDIEIPIKILIQEFYNKLYDFISNFKL